MLRHAIGYTGLTLFTIGLIMWAGWGPALLICTGYTLIVLATEE